LAFCRERPGSVVGQEEGMWIALFSIAVASAIGLSVAAIVLQAHQEDILREAHQEDILRG
jgi:hypothetical protein